ncbi:MAG: transposase [Coprothermobacterota bacterium]|nr:transposase [Coprothermobacterota bacterium]
MPPASKKGTDLFIEHRQAVFVADGDYRHYLENLREWKNAYSCSIYAYCLMTNHVHLILDPGEDERNLGCLTMSQETGKRGNMPGM